MSALPKRESIILTASSIWLPAAKLLCKIASIRFQYRNHALESGFFVHSKIRKFNKKFKNGAESAICFNELVQLHSEFLDKVYGQSRLLAKHDRSAIVFSRSDRDRRSPFAQKITVRSAIAKSKIGIAKTRSF